MNRTEIQNLANAIRHKDWGRQLAPGEIANAIADMLEQTASQPSEQLSEDHARLLTELLWEMRKEKDTQILCEAVGELYRACIQIDKDTIKRAGTAFHEFSGLTWNEGSIRAALESLFDRRRR